MKSFVLLRLDSAPRLGPPSSRMLKRLLHPRPLTQGLPDGLLLALRVSVGACLFFGHGIGKWGVFTGDSSGFPDPLGMGPKASVLSSMLTECVGSALVALGLLTRLACLAVVGTMLVVALIVHHHDAWGATEPSVLFALLYTVLAICGPGRLSLDALLWR